VCDCTNHWLKKWSNHKGGYSQHEQKPTNMMTSVGDGTSGYDNLLFVLSVFQSTT
jgi:hypothetical protein